MKKPSFKHDGVMYSRYTTRGKEVLRAIWKASRMRGAATSMLLVGGLTALTITTQSFT